MIASRDKEQVQANVVTVGGRDVGVNSQGSSAVTQEAWALRATAEGRGNETDESRQRVGPCRSRQLAIRFREAHRLARAVLERDQVAADTPARVGTLRAIAKLSLFRGRYEESLAYAQPALAAARRLGAPRHLVRALDEVGSALNTLGRIDEAQQCHEEALALARTLGDAELMSPILNSVAESRRSAGQLDVAERCNREALELARARRPAGDRRHAQQSDSCAGGKRPPRSSPALRHRMPAAGAP